MTAVVPTLSDTSRLKSRANLDKAGRQLEAVFTGMMLAEMRKANLAEPLFDSKAIDTFREMQDKQVAQKMADHAPLGIGHAVADFLGRSQSDLNEPPPDPAA